MQALMLCQSGDRLLQVVPGGCLMAPLLDRPVVWHQLTLLKDWGVTAVAFAPGLDGADLRDFVGDGTRWGLQIQWPATTADMVDLAVREGSVIVARPGEVVTGFVDPATLACGPGEARSLVAEGAKPDGVPSFVVLGAEAVHRLATDCPEALFLESALLSSVEYPSSCGIEHCGFEAHLVRSVDALLRANEAALRGDLPVLGGETVEVRPGIEIGAGASVSPTATLEGPLVIGEGAFVGDGAVLRRAVIGSGAAVGRGTVVEDSVVAERTFVGCHLEIRSGLAVGSVLAPAGGGEPLRVEDPFMLSSVDTPPSMTAVDVVKGAVDLLSAWLRSGRDTRTAA